MTVITGLPACGVSPGYIGCSVTVPFSGLVIRE